MPFKTQRVRDPIHGLIVFELDGNRARLDQTAWKLICTREFQRLRRVRQLGVSEFTFPGAVHTRFSHSIGVFHTARGLIEILRRLIPSADFNDDRANVAMLAALVHDLGHGPFSHAFESVQKAQGGSKLHEKWTAEIIRNPEGQVRPILEEFRKGITEDIATLLESDNPQDVFHAVVSSSLDADRLDYLRRDRLMSGSGAGSIDYDWIMDNIRIADISLAADDDDPSAPKVKTFCLHEKATQAAESFLLARYHLFQQVYLHKTTRGAEQCIVALVSKVADAARLGEEISLGLDNMDPLVRFFADKGATVENYLALDDFSVWTAMARIADGEDADAIDLARRLRDRRLLKCLDIDVLVPAVPDEPSETTEERRLRAIAKIDERVQSPDVFCLKDVSPISAYGEVGDDHTKRHKMISVLMQDNTLREITQLAPSIKAIVKKRSIVRYYFKDEKARDSIRDGVLA